jgi:hypothetical protein
VDLLGGISLSPRSDPLQECQTGNAHASPKTHNRNFAMLHHSKRLRAGTPQYFSRFFAAQENLVTGVGRL